MVTPGTATAGAAAAGLTGRLGCLFRQADLNGHVGLRVVRGDLIRAVYFPELLEEFTAFRSNRSAIGTIFRGLPRAPFSAAMNAALDIHTDKMVEAYGLLRAHMTSLASKIRPKT